MEDIATFMDLPNEILIIIFENLNIFANYSYFLLIYFIKEKKMFLFCFNIYILILL